MFAPTDAPAKLMELGEAEAVGFFDKDDARIGNVDTDFDDGGGDENIVFPIFEVSHDGFFVFGFHFSVEETKLEIGKNIFRETLMFGDGGFDIDEFFGRFDKREDDEGLAAFFDFTADEMVDEVSVGLIASDFGDNRNAFGRHFVQERDVEVAEEGEGEGARDRRGGHCQKVWHWCGLMRT